MEDTPPEMIRTKDAVAIARLLGDVAGYDGEVADRKRLLMNRLKELVDADGWLWSVSYCDHSKEQPMSVGVVHEGLTDTQFEGWVEASQLAKEPPPEDKPLAELLAKGTHYTRTRQQVVTDAEWYNHPTVKEYRFDRGIDDFLYSIYPLKDVEVFSAIGLYRHIGREKFTDRERRITHIILSNVEWLHYASTPLVEPKKIPTLTPTQRIVLVHLLDNKRRDEIASILGISPNTAKSHIRAVMGHYGAKDQTELLWMFRTGNGGDIANQ